MLSDGAGACSGNDVDPRAVMEPVVGPPPDDVSERDRLNVTMNNFSPSQVAVVSDMKSGCSTSVCRGGGHNLAYTPTPAAIAPASFPSVAHGVVLAALVP